MNLFCFQIVIPTYEREKVLIESLARYKDLPHLNKVSLLLLFWLIWIETVSVWFSFISCFLLHCSQRITSGFKVNS